MNGYVKITLLDQTGKIVSATLCTTDGNPLFDEEYEKPELIEKILICIRKIHTSTKF